MAIYIDIDRPYPSSIEVYSNELNKGGSKIVEVAFYSKNTPVDLTDVTVTAAFAIDKYLVAENVTVTKEMDNVCSVDISSTDNYQMFPGNLYVEFKFTKQDKEFYPSTVLVVKILPSIRMQSEVTPQSYGTVSEILQEVAEARGNFTSLDERFTADEGSISNLENDIEGTQTDLSNLRSEVNSTIGTVQGDINNILAELAKKTTYTDVLGSATVFNDYHSENNLYHTVVNNVDYIFFSINNGTFYKAQYRLSVNGLEYRVYDNEWSDWDIPVKNGSVTFGKLGTDAQTAINNKLPYQRLVKNTGGVPTALQVEDLNSLNLDHNTFYYIWLAYGFLYPTQPREWAVILELESCNQLIITKNGDIYSREKVSGVWSDFINPLASLLKTTDYSIGFNDEGMAVKKTINKTLNIGEFGSETKKVYVSNQVTRIGANFFTTATKVTDIYIDNTEGKVELPTIPERVTVHYKDEFKLSDLLVDSIIASNNAILAMRATVNEVNTTLENAINGVSE